MKYINSDIFGITFGFFFAIPTANDIFIDYIAPVILQSNPEPIFKFLILLIQTLIFILPLIVWFNLIKKYGIKMREIRTSNHDRNIIISIILGIFFGLIIQRIVF